jgi:hypothetical protein
MIRRNVNNRAEKITIELRYGKFKNSKFKGGMKNEKNTTGYDVILCGSHTSGLYDRHGGGTGTLSFRLDDIDRRHR